MKNEIRQAIRLSPELEDETFELQGEAFELLESGKPGEAEAKIKKAWSLLPEPKFNTSCSHVILCDLIEILTVIGRHEEAKEILNTWIHDLENSGYQNYETTPYILAGENSLYLNDLHEARKQFEDAVKYGASKRDFSDKPAFYFDIAKKKLSSDEEILKLFAQEIASGKKTNQVVPNLSDEVSEKIETWSEQGNDYADESHFADAIHVWQQALSLIPTPQNAFSESQWLEASIGDAYFLQEDYAKALEHFLNAKGNLETNAYENPFIMLRLGQAFLENQDEVQAKEYLSRAFMFEGEEIFENEDSKYSTFLKSHIQIS